MAQMNWRAISKPSPVSWPLGKASSLKTKSGKQTQLSFQDSFPPLPSYWRKNAEAIRFVISLGMPNRYHLGGGLCSMYGQECAQMGGWSVCCLSPLILSGGRCREESEDGVCIPNPPCLSSELPI